MHKILKIKLIFLFTICSLFVKASIPDSILLKEVKIVEKLIVKKKRAGLKFQKIDTLVLSNLSHRSLSEVLSENTPIFIKTYGRGSMATASFRGTAPSHTKVLWNNMEINSPMLGMVDFSLIPTWFMDDVNLSYGAASVKKSAGALGGSVEMTNKADWRKGFSLHTLSSAGSYKTYDQFISLNYSNRKFSSKTKAFYSVSDNDFKFFNKDIPASVDLKTGEISHETQKQKNADYKKYGFLQELYYKLSLKDMVSFKIWNQYSDRSLPQLSTNESNDKDSDGKLILNNINNQLDRSTRISSSWKHYFNKSNLKVDFGYINTNLDYYLDVKQNRGEKKVSNRVIDSESKIDTYMAKAELTGNIKERTRYSLSGEFSANRVDTKESVKKTGYKENRNKESFVLFMQHQWTRNISQNITLRQPFVDEKADPLIYVSALEYTAGEKKQFKLGANFTRNYNRPTLNDLYFQPGGNPDLKPEDGFTYEGNIGYTVSGKNYDLDLSTSAYKSDIDNWIIWLPNDRGFWEPFNLKNVKVTGLEFKAKLKGKLFNDLQYRLSGNYAYTKSINHGDGVTLGDQSKGKQLPFIPKHSSNLLLNIEYKDWFINHNFTYYSERFTTSSNDRKKEQAGRDLYPYYMNNISFGHRFLLKKKCLAEIKFRIDNLFDEDYRSILQRPMPRQNYTLLLDLKF
ncbi:TonB-dependent receptor plug domain-containing protein [Ancylomarina sp. DW003]|nr:TonB-dependent receptor [Ancylomarina sp. DW003]MDE5422825.1 TonB-dependent receptor plug domain-containing protein [Ancylomarina sp. DW003]